MIKLRLTSIGGLFLCLGALAQSAGKGDSPNDLGQRMLSEQKHFRECLASVYSPAFWISYNDSLYFQARNEAQMQQLEAMKSARSRYVVLTNRETRHEIAAKDIAASGIDVGWQRKLLLPYSATNQDLTPTLAKPVQTISRYKVLQRFAQGDALIQDAEARYLVMHFGRGADDAFGTNACLIKEGVISFADGNGFKRVDAFENVSLSAEERAVLNRVAAAFQKQAASPAPEQAAPKARQEFEDCQARATDSNPYMEYLLAKCYLEGKGTDKDEKLGMQWMNRAAKSGSGDAISYLEKSSSKAR